MQAVRAASPGTHPSVSVRCPLEVVTGWRSGPVDERGKWCLQTGQRVHACLTKLASNHIFLLVIYDFALVVKPPCKCARCGNKSSNSVHTLYIPLRGLPQLGLSFLCQH